MSTLTKLRCILPRSAKIRLILLVIGILLGAQIETLTLSIIQPFIMILMDSSIIYSNPILYLIYSFFGFNDVAPMLAFLATVIAVVYAFRGFYVYFFTRQKNRFLVTNAAILSNWLLIETLKKPYLYHANNNPVKLQQLVIKNAERFYGVVNNTLLLLIDGFMTLFILIFLVISSLSMTMVVLFFAVVCIFVYFKFFKNRIKTSGDDEAKGVIEINRSVLQALHGIKEIKITRRENYFTSKFKAIRIKTIKTKEQMQSLRQLPKLFMESLCFSGAFLVVATIILVGVDLQAIVPQLGVFMIAAFKLLPAISRMLNSITQIMRQMPSIKNVYKVLHEHDTEFEQILPAPEIDITSHDIIISGVTFLYPKARKSVLRNVSFIIPHNKSVGLVGASGAGKSTLVDVVLGILSPQSGSVTYNGKSIHHGFDDWAKNVGYVPQVIYLLDETLMENVAFGIAKNEIDESKVWYALEQAQLKEFVQSLPEGLQTRIGERGVRLSGGQRQRIGIARALYDNPTILVLDEATSSLDNETEEAVMAAIKSLQGSKTMIIIAHRLTTIEHCDIVYKVRRGTVMQVR